MIWQWSLTVALMLVGVVVWAWLSGALNDPEKETERDDARWETERYWKAREEQRAKEKRAQELNEVLDERQHRKNKEVAMDVNELGTCDEKCNEAGEEEAKPSPWQQIGKLFLDLRTVLYFEVDDEIAAHRLVVAFRSIHPYSRTALRGAPDECRAELARAKELLRGLE